MGGRLRIPGSCMVLAAGLLTGCAGEDTVEGRGHLPPSEATVTRTVPLIVPPGYQLRPDDETGDETAEDAGNGEGTVVDTVEQENAAAPDIGGPDTTPGEMSLMIRTGAAGAGPAIRDLLNRENALLAGDPELVENLLFGDHPSGEARSSEGAGDAASGVVIEQQPDESGWFGDL